MIALGLVRVIERHSDELAADDRETGNLFAHHQCDYVLLLVGSQAPSLGVGE